MARAAKDPTEAIRLKASHYPEVDEGTSCTQTSFKTGGKAFLFIGEQGGRYKAMFKLQESRPEAAKLGVKTPGDFQVGSGQWVTVRFSADKPVPASLWKKWLDESYELTRKPAKKRAVRKTAKKTTKKKSSPRKKA